MNPASGVGGPTSVRGNMSNLDIMGAVSRQLTNFEVSEGPKRITVELVKEEELQWLARRAIGHVKTVDFLPDLPYLLKEARFLNIQAMYVGGFRYLLECESAESLNKVLQEGKATLANWFEWIKPWHREVESSPTGRLCWLSIRRVPSHLWNEETFRKIAKV